MPSIFTHAAFAGLISRAALSRPLGWKFWLLSLLCPMAPDADAIAFAFRVPYGSMWSHRGITHSIAFAALLGGVIGGLAFRKKKPFATPWLILYFFLVTLSHPLLDMLTTGPWGVAIFAPFTAQRYQWPVRLIEVSPIGMGFFSSRGLDVFISEFKWVWLPALAVLGASLLLKKFRPS